jgi:hypothetical protein
MIEKAGYGSVVILEFFKTFFHAMVGRGFPNEFDFIWIILFGCGLMVE